MYILILVVLISSWTPGSTSALCESKLPIFLSAINIYVTFDFKYLSVSTSQICRCQFPCNVNTTTLCTFTCAFPIPWCTLPDLEMSILPPFVLTFLDLEMLILLPFVLLQVRFQIMSVPSLTLKCQYYHPLYFYKCISKSWVYPPRPWNVNTIPPFVLLHVHFQIMSVPSLTLKCQYYHLLYFYMCIFKSWVYTPRFWNVNTTTRVDTKCRFQFFTKYNYRFLLEVIIAIIAIFFAKAIIAISRLSLSILLEW